jgi:DNA-binding NarL/FixJ family response regulator
VADRPSTCHDGQVQTILIVDDNAVFRRQARAVLEADGLSVVGEAADGSSGLASARRLRPDLVLLDALLERVGLGDAGDRPTSGYSGGMRQRLGIAQALVGRPAVILTSSRDAREYGPRVGESRSIGFVPKDELSGAAIRALLGQR